MTHPAVIRHPFARCLAVAALSLLLAAPVVAQTVNGGIVRPGTLAPSALVNNGTTPSNANFYRGDGTWQAVTGGYTLPIASGSILGGVKIGSGILEAGDGTISVTASSVGGAYTATAPITITGTAIGVNQASATNFGVMEVGSGLQAASGIVSLQSILLGGATAYPASLTTDNYGRVTAIAAGVAPGSVTSVGLSLPSGVFTVTGSPVTGSGTLAGSLAAQSANQVFAGPSSGSAAAPAFRALAAADLPSVGTAGTYGDGSHYPVITTDAQGRVSGVTTQAVTGGGGGGTISVVTSDPVSPATGTFWYRSDLHKLRVKEASAVYGTNFVIQSGKPPLGSTIDTGLSISAGIVLSYLMVEGSGTSLTDFSSTADTGTLSSASLWATDTTYTDALAFTGSQYASNSYKAALNIETVTVALAFKTTSTSLQILYYQGANTTSTNAISSEIYVNGGAVIFNCADTTNSVISSAASTYADGNWHTVLATRTRHGAITLNVDSATQVTGTDATSSTTSTTSLLTLGARPTSGTGPTAITSLPYTGSLAYVTVWNRVLSNSEIAIIQADPFAMYR